MSSRILIRKCDNPQRALIIADEIARQSGYSPETIYRALIEKTVCIRKRAGDGEALALKTLYGALGATVEIVPNNVVARQPVPFTGASVKPDDDDDDDEKPVRLLTDKEFAQQVRERSDIFYVESNRRAQITESVSLVCSVLFCLYLGSREPVVITDFIDPEMTTVFSGAEIGPVDRPPEIQREVTPKPPVQFTDQKTIQRAKPGSGGTNGGGGSIRERVAKAGVIGLISGQIKGHTLADGEMFAKGGFASDIDAILSGLGGLKTGGGGGAGRMAAIGIGFGTGVGSGTGGESGLGGVEDLIGNFSRASLALSTPLKPRGTLAIQQHDIIRGGDGMIGGRSKLSISRVVAQNIAALRHAYNKRLREKPGLKGKIVIKFAIDEFGKVIFCKLEESTLTDEVLEVAVVDKIKFWKFEKIDKPGDVTEVVYPFVFSQ